MKSIQQKFREYRLKKFIENWPTNAPIELRSLNQNDAMAAYQLAADTESMPDAELPDFMVALRNVAKNAESLAWRGLINSGEILLKIEEKTGEAEFWPHVGKAFPGVDREYIEIAIEAALEEAK